MASELTEMVDLCIVGSGAGGGVVAKECSEKGASVVILEAGPRTIREKIPTVHPDWERRRQDFLPLDNKRDALRFDVNNDPIEITRFKGVGGSTMHFEGFCQRVHPEDLRRRSELGAGVDWPLAYQELAPLYDRVEAIIGLSGELDNPFEPPRSPYPHPAVPMSCAVKTLKKGCDSLGLHACHAPLAILSRAVRERNSCNYCGGCWFGCRRRAIGNMEETYLPIAEAQGTKILENCTAVRVVVKDDRVLGIEYLNQKGDLHLQKAKAFVICGNGIETPRLLLNSRPGGIANSSGQVGKNFMAHTGLTLSGLFEQRINGHMGPNINGMVQDFYKHDNRRGFVGGYLIALKNAQLGPLHFYESWAKRKNLFGARLQQYMIDQFGHAASVGATGEVFPNPHNQVSLDPEAKDSFGLPLPKISIRLDENSRSMLKHMEKTLRDILSAADAKEIAVTFPPQILGTQLLGTCRMGDDPRESVTNSYGQTHDIRNLFVADGSLFPTSTPSNSTLTIQALATRVAAYLADRLRRGEL